MTRRIFARHGILVLLAAFALGLPSATLAQHTIDPDGKYDLIDPAQPTDTPGKVEIVDVFWYGCPHCYRFLPSMEALDKRKADYVAIRRMPAIFRDSWAIHARAYYTAKLLDVVERIHRPLFVAIHDKNQALNTPASLRAFFVAHGVEGKTFDKTFESFAVETMLRKSTLMQGRYGVRGTPSVIVNGKYRVSAEKAGGYAQMVDVAEALAAREHKATMAMK
ncbi:MAG: thiol:disulfide interchange protein DsbA [Gammaproteobacteria bacterium]|jgi:thiol:disulfide interchange protein DsbA